MSSPDGQQAEGHQQRQPVQKYSSELSPDGQQAEGHQQRQPVQQYSREHSPDGQQAEGHQHHQPVQQDEEGGAHLAPVGGISQHVERQ